MRKKTIQFKRKLRGRTDYKKRLVLLGSSKPRLVIRKSLNNLVSQIVEYHPKGDRVICSSHSKELEKFGWTLNRGNIPASYLTGLLLGKRAKEKKIKEAVLDMGLCPSTKGSRLYAALKGVVDAGISVPHSKEILPDDERVKGGHIASFKKTKEITQIFEEVRKKIIG